jgi:signal transduction histidine kinase
MPRLTRLPIRWRLALVFAAAMALVLIGAGTATVLQFRDAVAEGDPTGLLQAHADDIVADLIRELLIVLPVVLLVAVLAAYTLSCAALRPVEAMRRQAEGIDADQHDHQLPVPAISDEIARLGHTLNAMLTQTQRLTQLAEDLLTLSRADRGHTTPPATHTAIAPLLGAIADRFRPALDAENRTITVDVPPGLSALIHHDDLNRALANLVDNSRRHATGEIAITAQHTNGHTEVHVVDQGPGFPDDFLPHAFDRFTRPDTARTQHGTGLGLAITAALIAANGGCVHADNHATGGADVWIEIPTQTAD